MYVCSVDNYLALVLRGKNKTAITIQKPDVKSHSISISGFYDFTHEVSV